MLKLLSSSCVGVLSDVDHAKSMPREMLHETAVSSMASCGVNNFVGWGWALVTTHKKCTKYLPN